MSVNHGRPINRRLEATCHLLDGDETTYWHDGTATTGAFVPAITAIASQPDADIPCIAVLTAPADPGGEVARIDMRASEALAFAYSLCQSAVVIASDFEDETCRGVDVIATAREAFLDLFERAHGARH